MTTRRKFLNQIFTGGACVLAQSPLTKAAGAITAINVGGPTIERFSADTNTGGSAAYYPNTIDNFLTPDVPQEVLRSERWGGHLKYIITNIPPGKYIVRLPIAEIYFNNPGQRRFNIAINGKPVANNVDIIATAGAKNRGINLEYATSPNASGRIIIDATRGSADYPKLSAIEILPNNTKSPVFARSSFWYQQLPTNAPIHPNSANFVQDFLRQKDAYYGTVTINTTAYASPVYRANANTPTTRVRVWDCFNRGYTDPGLGRQFSSVPIPSFAAPADGTDSEMTIYQAPNRIWEFWQMRKVNRQWEACWGGRMDNVSKNPGIWPYPYGTTATGLPFLGGQITAEELQRGVIDHVLGISLVEVENYTVFSWPANRSDGYNPDNAPNRIPEGLRFRLNPNVNVEALSMHPIGKIIARAAQRWGFVVWDKAGAISLRAQNPKSYTQRGQPDPYKALFKGTPEYGILEGFPWDRLEFMPMDYGRA